MNLNTCNSLYLLWIVSSNTVILYFTVSLSCIHPLSISMYLTMGQFYVSGDTDSSSSRYDTSIDSSWSDSSRTVQSNNHVISCSVDLTTTFRRWNHSPIRIVPLSPACSIRIICSPTTVGVISVTLQSTRVSYLWFLITISNQVDINDTVVGKCDPESSKGKLCGDYYTCGNIQVLHVHGVSIMRSHGTSYYMYS